MKATALLAAAWVLAAVGSAPLATAAEMTGKDVFDHYCTYCQGAADGPGTAQLGRTRGKDRALLTQRTDLKPEYVEYVVRHWR